MQSPNLFQILHCFIHHTPRQFRPSLPFFFFLFLRTLPTRLHLECCATPFMLLFQQRNAHYHISFFNSSHNFDSLRSASMWLSDERSLYSSIPHRTAAQPVFGTKSFHCSQIPFVFLNLLIGVEQRCLARNESLFASILSRKWSAHHPMDCERVWLHSTRYSHIKPEFWPSAMSEESAESSHSSTSLFGLNLLFLYIAPSNPEYPVMRAFLELSVMNVEKEMSMVKEGRRSNSEDGCLRWINDVRWKMFKISHLREIDRTNE